MTTALLVICLSQVSSSGAADLKPAADKAAPVSSERDYVTRLVDARTSAGLVRSDSCTSARKAVRYYSRKLNEWRVKMGAPGTTAASLRNRLGRASNGCPHYLAHVLQRKAHAARLAYERWSHEWEWQRWLPAKFVRVGHCETGHTWGQNFPAGNWRWDSGTYVSAFGIYRPAYEAYHRWTGHNTPREQYEVAASIQRHYGWYPTWGCGNA